MCRFVVGRLVASDIEGQVIIRSFEKYYRTFMRREFKNEEKKRQCIGQLKKV